VSAGVYSLCSLASIGTVPQFSCVALQDVLLVFQVLPTGMSVNLYSISQWNMRLLTHNERDINRTLRRTENS
jgi:hypothetical protein